MTLKEAVTQIVGDCRKRGMTFPLVVIVACKKGELASFRIIDERADQGERLASTGDTQAIEAPCHIVVIDQSNEFLHVTFEPFSSTPIP